MLPSVGYGGCESFSIRIALEFKKEYDVEFLLTNELENYEFKKYLNQLKIKTYWLKYDYSGDSFRYVFLFFKKYFYLLKIIKSKSPDFIYLNIPWPTMGFIMLLVCSIKSFKSIALFHCVPEDLKQNYFRKIIYNLYISRNITLLTQTNSKASLLKKQLGSNNIKINILPNGIYINELLHSKRDYELLNKEYIKLISVGRLSFEKGYRILFKEIKNIDFVEFKLDVFGEGPLYNNLVSQINEYGLHNKVKLNGYSENIITLMMGYDFLILSSLHESFPTVILEAMSSGLIVISSNFKGVDEIIDHEKDGFICDFSVSGSFKNLISRLLSDEFDLNKVSQNAIQKSNNYIISNVYLKSKHFFLN